MVTYPWKYDASLNSMKLTLPDGSSATFPVFGYRSATGSEVHFDGESTSWTNIAGSSTLARYLIVGKNGISNVQSNVILYGFGLRPAADE